MILIIMLLVALSVVLKMSYLPLPGRLAVGTALALFVGLSGGYASEQSKTQIAAWIQDPEFMLDIAVVLTVDVFLQLAFCLTEAAEVAGERLKKVTAIIRAICLYIPGILIFPVLTSLLVEVIFSFPGADFSVVAWSVAALVFIAFSLLPFAMKVLLPEADLRLEMLFMVNALIAMLGIVATVNGRTAVPGSSSVEALPLAGVIALFFVGAAMGYIIFRRKQKRKIL